MIYVTTYLSGSPNDRRVYEFTLEDDEFRKMVSRAAMGSVEDDNDAQCTALEYAMASGGPSALGELMADLASKWSVGKVFESGAIGLSTLGAEQAFTACALAELRYQQGEVDA